VPGDECTPRHRCGNSAHEDLRRHAPSLRRLVSIVFVTQVVDPDDPVLGFVVPQLRALAELCDLVVIANEVRSVPADLQFEVISLGKEVGRGTLARGGRYLAVLWRCFRRRRTDALVAHMCPIYLTIAAPLTRLFGITSLLWFLHPSDTPALRIAEALADRVITAFPDSFPHAGRKVLPIGHAIDVDALEVGPLLRPPGSPLHLLALGRTSPIKHYCDIIDAAVAAARRGVDLELLVVGPSTTAEEREHRQEMQRRIPDDLAPRIRIDPAVPRSEIPSVIAHTHVLVNATESGSADKVVFEAMAAGRVTLTSSAAFAALVEPIDARLVFPAGDVEVLSERLVELAGRTEPSLQELGARLREQVTAEHSLEHWAQAVTTLAGQGRRRGLPGIARWFGTDSP